MLDPLFTNTGQLVPETELLILRGPFNENWGLDRSTCVEIELPFAALLRKDFLASVAELLDKVAVDCSV